MALLGGPVIEGVIPRTAATDWLTAFISHPVFALFNIRKTRKTFRCIDPTSLIPNWQDLMDIVRMYKWFLGFTSRPKHPTRQVETLATILSALLILAGFLLLSLVLIGYTSMP